MNINKRRFFHLLNNLDRTSYKNSVFNYDSGRKALLSLGQGSIREWLETLLPNTKLIIEPKIIGLDIGIQYIEGKFNKAINENSEDLTENVNYLSCIPKMIPIKNRLEIRGVLYNDDNSTDKNKIKELIDIKKASIGLKELKFCAFHIFYCNINQFQALQELKSLNFEIPETESTNFLSDVEIYRQCWNDEKLFQKYPTSGIVLKINSRKLQKYYGENNISRHWAYAIN